MDEDLVKEIRKCALQNAIEHDGKTKDKIVLSKILGNRPDLRNNAKEIIKEVTGIVSEVNNIPLSKQMSEIESNYPELLTKTEKKIEEKTGLPPLKDAVQGEVVT